MLMQNFRGANKMHYGKCRSGVWTLNLNWSQWSGKRVKTIKELWIVFRTSVPCFFFFFWFHRLKTWFEISRVKLYGNDLKGNKNYFELAGREVRVIKGKKIWHRYVGNPGEIDFGSIELARGSINRESTELTRKIVLRKYQKTLEGRPAAAVPSKLTQWLLGHPRRAFANFPSSHLRGER